MTHQTSPEQSASPVTEDALLAQLRAGHALAAKVAEESGYHLDPRIMWAKYSVQEIVRAIVDSGLRRSFNDGLECAARIVQDANTSREKYFLREVILKQRRSTELRFEP